MKTAEAPDATGVAPLEMGPKKKKSKYPCGKCTEEVGSKSLFCKSCEYWFHYKSVREMSKEWLFGAFEGIKHP